MRVVYANNQSQIINVGRQGENLATAVYFDLSELIAVFGEGTFAIVHKRAGDETPYPVTHTERIEDSAVWTLDATDTAIAGVCKVELRWYVDEVLAKTVVYDIVIQTSLGVTGDVPDPYEDIIDTIAGYAQDAENAKDAAQGYAGTASQSAIDAAASERAAGASETAAANSERAASGYALTASQKADAASSSAQTASDKASAAQGYAQTASGKASEAQGYAQTASDKADAAAASAQTASDKADAAADSAADAEAAAASIVVDSALSRTSEHPVQNKVITLALDDKASAIKKTASGSVASFADGADGIPMVSVVADIDAVQSGSGDPSPDNVRPISGWDSVNVTVSPTLDTQDGTTYTITLPQTVYGGTLDVVSGVLTIDTYCMLASSRTWNKSPVANNRINCSLPVRAKPRQCWCSHFKPITSGGMPTADGTIYVNTAAQIIINYMDGVTLEQWNAFLASENVQIAYEMETPQTIQLTPQEVDSLLADNNLWADSGNVSVTYRADSTLAYEQLTNAIVSLGGNI